MLVAVGSINPIKIESVRLAFSAVWPDRDWTVKGIDVESGVSAQPMSDTESMTGARNRAVKSLIGLKADFGVGLEGGLQKIDDRWLECGWIIVVDKAGYESIGSTIKMSVPKKIMGLIDAGKELGEACDIVFNKVNSKQSDGYFGLMSDNLITRTEGYKDGVIAALAGFIHQTLYH